MAITAAQIVAISDHIAAWYLKAASTGFGTDGAGGAYDCASNLLDTIIGTASAYSIADYTAISALASPANTLMNASTPASVAGGYLAPVMSALDQVCAAYGVSQSIAAITNLETFATYYNVTYSTKWSCLFTPNFRSVVTAWRPSLTPTANFYFEILQGATYTNGLRKLVVVASTPTQTAGTDIVSTSYAGGYGQIVTTGFAGASDTVTVAGLWRKTDGTTHTGNGTATVTGNNTYVLTPPAADELLITCTGITAGANITGLTCYAEAKAPSGRTNPPTS